MAKDPVCGMEDACVILRTTADKREIKDFPKLSSATSFIRKTLYKVLSQALKKELLL